MRVPQPDYDTTEPAADLQREADDILGSLPREARVFRPLARVKAWAGVKAAIQVVSGDQVWTAWQRFSAAHETAQAGGDYDGLLELHDDFERLLKAWLSGPRA